MIAFRLIVTALFANPFIMAFTHIAVTSTILTAHQHHIRRNHHPHHVGSHRMQLMDVNDSDESSFFNVNRAHEIAKPDTECSIEELHQFQQCIHLYDVQNSVYGWCSEHEMNLEILERAIQEKLERKQSPRTEQRDDASTEVIPASTETVTKTNNKHAPKSIRDLQLDVEKAVRCSTTGQWPSDLEEMEEMESSLHILDAEQSIYGVADIEGIKFQLIEQAIQMEMQKLQDARSDAFGTKSLKHDQ